MSFYLTNVNIIEKKKNREENKNETNKIELNQIKNNTEKKIKIKEQKKEKKTIKKEKEQSRNIYKKKELNLNDEIKYDYFTFLVEKNIKYANMDKIEDFYLKEINKKKKIYNDNLNLIKKKKNEIREFIENSNNLIVNNYIIYVDSTDSYDKFIDFLKEKIKIKENDLIVYKHMKKRLYNTNIKIINRIQNELMYEEIISSQFSQYHIIQNHAIFQLKTEKKKLNRIKYIYKKKIVEQKKELFDKIEKMKNLNDDIKNLNDEEDEYKKYLKQLRKKTKKIKEYIINIKDYNKRLFYDNKTTMKEYLHIKFKLDKIFYSLKMKKLENLIINYNNHYEKLYQFHQKFYYINSEIVDLNKEYSKLDKQLIEIKNNIFLKEKNNECDNLEENKKTKGFILLSKKEQDKIKEIIKNKNIILNLISNFLLNQIKKLSKNIPRINSVISNDVTKFIQNEKDFSINLDNQNLSDCLKQLCHFFFQFSNSIAFIILSSFSFGINTHSISQPPINIINLRKKSIVTNRKLINDFSNLTEKDFVKENNKIKVNVLKKNNSQKNSIIPKDNITENEMFQNFIQFIKKKNNFRKYNYNKQKELSTDLETKQYFIEKNYYKLNSFIRKYENELVEKMNKSRNKNNENKNRKTIKIQNKTKNITENFTQSYPYLDDNMEIDFEDDNDDIIEKSKKKKKNTLSLSKWNNKEKNNIFLRIDDLRNLNSSFFNRIIGGKNKNNLTYDIELQAKYYEYLKKEKEEKKKNKIQFDCLRQHKHKTIRIKMPKTFNNENIFDKKKKLIRCESMMLPCLKKFLFDNEHNNNDNNNINNNNIYDYYNKNKQSSINKKKLTRIKHSNNSQMKKNKFFASSFYRKRNYYNSNNFISNKTTINLNNGIFYINRKSNSLEKINRPLNL